MILEIEENVPNSDEILSNFHPYEKNEKINSDICREHKNNYDRKNVKLTDNFISFPSYNGSDNFLCRLVSRIKSSLVGQMMKYFGILSERQWGVSHQNNNKIGIVNHKEVSWESLLRSSCTRNVLWAENIKIDEFRNVPFCIRRKEKIRKMRNKKKSTIPSQLFSLLELAEKVNHPSSHSNFLSNDLYKSVKSINCISERNIFTVFIHEALDEVKMK